MLGWVACMWICGHFVVYYTIMKLCLCLYAIVQSTWKYTWFMSFRTLLMGHLS